MAMFCKMTMGPRQDAEVQAFALFVQGKLLKSNRMGMSTQCHWAKLIMRAHIAGAIQC